MFASLLVKANSKEICEKYPFLNFSENADVSIFWDSRLIISKKCVATPTFLCGISNSLCKGLLFSYGPYLAQQTLYLVCTVLKECSIYFYYLRRFVVITYISSDKYHLQNNWIYQSCPFKLHSGQNFSCVLNVTTNLTTAIGNQSPWDVDTRFAFPVSQSCLKHNVHLISFILIRTSPSFHLTMLCFS